jgi:kynurenine formamidase
MSFMMYLGTNYIDMTHSLSATVPAWDEELGFRICVRHDYQAGAGTSFLVQDFEMPAGIGTHMDAPAHCFKQGKTIDEIPLSDLIAPCAVIDVAKLAHENFSLKIEHIKTFEEAHGPLPKRSIVIVRTGWDRYFLNAQKYRNNLSFPTISQEAACYLLDKDIVALGVDTLSPDGPHSGFLVHEALLGAGRYIVENVANSALLPPFGAHVIVLPMKVAQATESPVRMIGIF